MNATASSIGGTTGAPQSPNVTILIKTTDPEKRVTLGKIISDLVTELQSAPTSTTPLPPTLRQFTGILNDANKKLKTLLEKWKTSEQDLHTKYTAVEKKLVTDNCNDRDSLARVTLGKIISDLVTELQSAPTSTTPLPPTLRQFTGILNDANKKLKTLLEKWKTSEQDLHTKYTAVEKKLVIEFCGYKNFLLPTISTVTPLTATIGEKQTFTIEGANFPKDAQVNFLLADPGKESDLHADDITIAPDGKSITFTLTIPVKAITGQYLVGITSESQPQLSALSTQEIVIKKPAQLPKKSDEPDSTPKLTERKPFRVEASLISTAASLDGFTFPLMGRATFSGKREKWEGEVNVNGTLALNQRGRDQKVRGELGGGGKLSYEFSPVVSASFSVALAYGNVNVFYLNPYYYPGSRFNVPIDLSFPIRPGKDITVSPYAQFSHTYFDNGNDASGNDQRVRLGAKVQLPGTLLTGSKYMPDLFVGAGFIPWGRHYGKNERPETIRVFSGETPIFNFLGASDVSSRLDGGWGGRAEVKWEGLPLSPSFFVAVEHTKSSYTPATATNWVGGINLNFSF
jgi:hypothetical protein